MTRVVSITSFVAFFSVAAANYAVAWPDCDDKDTRCRMRCVQGPFWLRDRCESKCTIDLARCRRSAERNARKERKNSKREQ